LNIAGIDIGYSNLKLTFGDAESQPRSIIRPAGAAPADRFSRRIDGRNDESYLHVLVDEVPFIAGVAQDQANMWTRALHADYTSSQSYKALFHAGLLLTEMEHIDTLVTGLPVTQYMDDERKKSIEQMMTGTHQVTPKRSVTVDKVRVIPQPVGGFLDCVENDNGATDFGEARVLVIDPGFFSVDWVVIADSQLSRPSSGTSLEASSVLLEQVALMIADDHGSSVSTEKLENAVRNHKSSVMVMGKIVELTPYLAAAAKIVGHVVIENIHKSLRKEMNDIDLVLLVGGGAMFFHESTKAAFPRINVYVPDEPVLSNSRGYWLMGASK